MTRSMRSILVAMFLSGCWLTASGEPPLSAAEQQARTLGARGNANAAAAAASPDTRRYPGYQGAAVPATQYYDDGYAIEQEARAQAETDPVGQYVQQSAARRPDAGFARNDPMLQQEDQANASDGVQPYCPGGGCVADVPVVESAEGDFAYAATALTAAQTAADELDEATMTMFKGRAMKCSQDDFGFADCCADDGWGQDAGLAQCSAEEQALGLAKQGGMTHYVGRYETGVFDTTTKKSYCVYTSMLSRIIAEAGHAQLGIGWGSARRPDCRALTPAEVQAIDWSNIDFSEFYATAQSNADAAMQDMETRAQIEQRVQRRLDQMTGSSTPANAGGGG
jgi:hypothetical protein